MSEFNNIIKAAIQTYGKENQIMILFEEMAELQNALCKIARGRDNADHVCEEIADVLIMCYQMAAIYGEERVTQWVSFKMNRLKNRLQEAQN